jgi:hypothetical protein
VGASGDPVAGIADATEAVEGFRSTVSGLAGRHRRRKRLLRGGRPRPARARCTSTISPGSWSAAIS